MKYCKYCGQMLTEGEGHFCEAMSTSPHTSPPATTSPGASTRPSTFQAGTIKTFLMNPFHALKNQERDWFQYGWLGMVAHILAYFIWGWALYEEAVHSFTPFLSFFAEDADLSANSDFLFNFFLLAIVTTAGLPAGYFFLGNVFGDKQDFRQSVGVLGTGQWAIALGYVLAAVICFMSMRFSVVLVLLITIVNYSLLSHTTFRYFRIRDEKKIYYIASVFVAYAVLLWLFLKIMN